MNVNEKVSISICCGCGVCASACPTNAIKLGCDSADWHLYPKVDEKSCVDCNLCVKVCPAINEKKQNSFNAYGYAAVAEDDVRRRSSSGGVFYLFAKSFIESGGYVAGAVFDKDLVVRHIVSSDINDVERMRDSKYVQSDASLVYREIKNLLSQNQRVLFCGTPCQVAALKNYVGDNNTKNLLCIDIICHGVPSPKVFDYYLRENFDKAQIDRIMFRNKEHRNGNPGTITFFMKDGRVLYSEHFDNSYYEAFLQNLLERESCFDCKFSEFPRVGDISIGDFWGAKTTDTKIDYEKGCSIIIINNGVGEKQAKKILKALKHKESYSIETLMSWNRNKRELEHNPNYKELPVLIEKHNSLRVAADSLLHDKYDVGVFGVTMNPNFGGLITYWALYKAIENMGYRTVIIARPINSADSKDITHSTHFFKKHCNTTEQIESGQLAKLNDKIDKFVLGSDQVWNYNLFRCWENTLYFDFVKDSAIKIAYAASFGSSDHSLPNDRIGQVSKYFKHFDYIGVRELDGVNILKNNYSVDATHVMDPVFLVNEQEYAELAELSDVDFSEEYVGSYIIEPNDFKLNVVRTVTNHLGVNNLNLTDGDPKHFSGKSQWFKDRDMHIQSNATIYDWLKMIKNAKFVVTDSYHAVCFCLMFKKPFIILQERWALSRIQSIMDIFGLHERWLKISKIDDFEINKGWFLPLPTQTERILKAESASSREWLKRSLDSSKTISETSRFCPYIDKNRVEDYFFFLLKKRRDIVLVVSSCSMNKQVLSSIDFKCKLSYAAINTDKSKSFVMLYDFDKDYLETKNEDYNEIKYQIGEKKLICITDRSSVPFANNIYVFGRERYLTKSNPDAPLVISVYSKSAGRIVDSFEVFLHEGVAMIKR